MSFHLLKPSEVPAMFYQNYSGFFTLSACRSRRSESGLKWWKSKQTKKRWLRSSRTFVTLEWQMRLPGGNKLAARWTPPLLAKLAITVHYKINWALKQCSNTSEGKVAQNCSPNSIIGILQCFILSMRCTYLDMGSVVHRALTEHNFFLTASFSSSPSTTF